MCTPTVSAPSRTSAGIRIATSPRWAWGRAATQSGLRTTRRQSAIHPAGPHHLHPRGLSTWSRRRRRLHDDEPESDRYCWRSDSNFASSSHGRWATQAFGLARRATQDQPRLPAREGCPDSNRHQRLATRRPRMSIRNFLQRSSHRWSPLSWPHCKTNYHRPQHKRLR